jgi:branched-subunit amino acid aminotransferase/4-amino-4-deoxychorismate lyase
MRRQVPAIIETLLLDADGGVRHLSRHLRRLARTAGMLGVACPVPLIRRRLVAFARRQQAPCIVRMELERDHGRARLKRHPLWRGRGGENGGALCTRLPGGVILHLASRSLGRMPPVLRLAVADVRVHAGDWLLRHKTTRRGFLDGARRRAGRRHGADEVIFLNTRGELTEGSFTNIFVRLIEGGPLLTPPLRCGLLPGVLRQRLLERGEAVEQVLVLHQLRGAREILVGNDVRGLMPARLLRKT